MQEGNEQMRIEIEEAIQKNMPNQVGILLKKRLEQAEADAKAVKELTSKVDGWVKLYNDEKAKVEEYKKFDERNRKLEEREQAVAEKERNQKVFEAELKLAEAEKRITDNVNFVGMVFKSPVFRTHTNKIENGTFQWNGQRNCNEFIPSGGHTTDVSKTMD